MFFEYANFCRLCPHLPTRVARIADYVMPARALLRNLIQNHRWPWVYVYMVYVFVCHHTCCAPDWTHSIGQWYRMRPLCELCDVGAYDGEWGVLAYLKQQKRSEQLPCQGVCAPRITANPLYAFAWLWIFANDMSCIYKQNSGHCANERTRTAATCDYKERQKTPTTGTK